MRRIVKVFIHCSASDNPDHDDVEVIKRWHIERGFSDVGYHYFIKKSGKIQDGRPLEKIPAAQKGHNRNSIAICLSGLDHFTEKQFRSLKELCEKLDDRYQVTFHGHCEVSNKTCPNFAYKAVLNLDLDGRMVRPALPEVFTDPKAPTLWERFLSWLDKLSMREQ